jgi:hypothetical protein
LFAPGDDDIFFAESLITGITGGPIVPAYDTPGGRTAILTFFAAAPWPPTRSCAPPARFRPAVSGALDVGQEPRRPATVRRQVSSIHHLEIQMLDRYDPDSPPDPERWLASDDDSRLSLIIRAHRKLATDLPSESAHATIHLIVENQVAMGDQTPAAATVERLMGEGLSRHDAIHAVGYVLTAHIHELLQSPPDQGIDPNQKYYGELQRLTAAGWLEQYE